jgi:hypothetical protein
MAWRLNKNFWKCLAQYGQSISINWFYLVIKHLYHWFKSQLLS